MVRNYFAIKNIFFKKNNFQKLAFSSTNSSEYEIISKPLPFQHYLSF